METVDYKEITKKSISHYIDKYDFNIEIKSYGVKIFNKNITIDISYKYQEFEMLFSNGLKKISFAEVLFSIYPDYIQMVKQHPEMSIFDQNKIKENIEKAFAYILKTSFDFINKNRPLLYNGII